MESKEPHLTKIEKWAQLKLLPGPGPAGVPLIDRHRSRLFAICQALINSEVWTQWHSQPAIRAVRTRSLAKIQTSGAKI